jgi:tRNA nucleotidyltransferase/poly(A) polymerase
VGGAVRDWLLGKRPRDIDVAALRAEAVARHIAERLDGRVVTIGRSEHPLHRVVRAGWVVDVSPLVGGTIHSDLAARDFTINALACDLATGKIVDPFEGRKDLGRHTVQALSRQAIVDDPVRLLRAFRLAAQLAFDIEPATSRMLREESHLIRKPAAERILQECDRLLEVSDSAATLNRMAAAGLLPALLPELRSAGDTPKGRGPARSRQALALQALAALERLLIHCPERFPDSHSRIAAYHASTAARNLKWALLIGSTVMPSPTEEEYRPSALTAEQVRAVQGRCRRLRFSNRRLRYVQEVLRYAHLPMALFARRAFQTEPGCEALRMFTKADAGLPDVLLLAAAWHNQASAPWCSDAYMAYTQRLFRLYATTYRPLRTKAPLVTGADLIREMDLRPSPLFKQLLGEAETARLCGRITTSREALSLIRVRLESGCGTGQGEN